MKILLFQRVYCFGGVSGPFLYVCLSDPGSVSIEIVVLSFDFCFEV